MELTRIHNSKRLTEDKMMLQEQRSIQLQVKISWIHLLSLSEKINTKQLLAVV